jgi:transglutaminase-like putative cysteine protease
MRPILLCLQLTLVFASYSAQAQPDLDSLIAAGELGAAQRAIRAELVGSADLSSAREWELGNLLADIRSVSGQFVVSYEEMFAELKNRIPDLTSRDIARWEEENLLEYMLIDGEKRYFWGWESDLLHLSEEARRRAGIAPYEARPRHSESLIQEVIDAAAGSSTPFVCPRLIHVSFTYFEDISEVPDGQVIRAWLPIARQNQFQDSVEIVKSPVKDYLPPRQAHRVASVYFECRADIENTDNSAWADYFSKPREPWIKPLDGESYFTNSRQIHQIVFRYRAVGLYRDIDPAAIEPWDDPGLEPYARAADDITASPYLRSLVHEIVGEEANPYLQAKAIYYWICRNITWTNPIRTFGNDVERSARLRRGDCGAKARLFIALCRLKGIPARSQGGWRVQPGRRHSQHTWAQAYFAPYGWLPVDPDAGSHFIDHHDGKIRFFHFGNCSPYRLVIYDDDSPFFPLPIHLPRGCGGSQLGMFEWRGGSLETDVKIDTAVRDLP